MRNLVTSGNMIRLCCLLPDVLELVVRDFFSSREPIHDFLVPGGAELYDDVIDARLKLWGVQER